mgnify:FL=1|jgi:hypothetical protein
MELNDIVLYWFLFVSVSSMIGAFIGTLLAFGARALTKKWMEA